MRRILANIFNALLDRNAYITIKYLYDFTGEEHKKVLDTFSIHIDTFRKSSRLTGISTTSAGEVYQMLQTPIKSIELQKGSDTCYEYLIVPKWAFRMLADDIRRNILN